MHGPSFLPVPDPRSQDPSEILEGLSGEGIRCALIWAAPSAGNSDYDGSEYEVIERYRIVKKTKKRLYVEDLLRVRLLVTAGHTNQRQAAVPAGLLAALACGDPPPGHPALFRKMGSSSSPSPRRLKSPCSCREVGLPRVASGSDRFSSLGVRPI
jgi:hypothetical protein